MLFANTLISIAKVIQKQIDDEMYNIPKIQEELSILQMKLEAEEITESEYDLHELNLLERLRIAQNKKNEV